MNLNDLPDLCLRKIFSRLETSDLYGINNVCQYWASLQTTVCTKINTLYLFIGQETDKDDFAYQRNEFQIPYIEQIESKEIRDKYTVPEFFDNEKLKFEWLSSYTVEKLINLFPNIKRLKIFVNFKKKAPSQFASTYSIIPQLITLLEFWSPSLQSFFFAFAPFSDEPNLFEPLVVAINNLQNLEEFIFKSRNITVDSIPNLSLTILGQLKEFRCDLWCYDERERFFLSHVNFIKLNPKLEKLSFGLVSCSEILSMDIFSNQQTNFYQKFTSFPFLEFLHPDEDMQNFCRKFSNLDRLDILFHSHKELYRMSKLWKHMQNLIFLDMFANYPADNEEDEFPDDPDPKPIPNYSVRILNIFTSPHSHDELYDIKWNLLFPNLEILHFNDRYLKCSICQIPQRDDTDSEYSDSESDEREYSEENTRGKQKYSIFRNLFRFDEHVSKRNECLKHCLQPWKQCSKLKKVYIGNSTAPKLVDFNQLWS